MSLEGRVASPGYQGHARLDNDISFSVKRFVGRGGSCEEARTELGQRGLPGSCECSRLDLGDFSSVRQFAAATRQRVRQTKRPIDILVNNAGLLSFLLQKALESYVQCLYEELATMEQVFCRDIAT